MKLEYKPDFEEARTRWDAFWEGEIIGRPCLHIVTPKESVEAPPGPNQLSGFQKGFREAVEMYDAHAAALVFMAEAMPYVTPSFGPDQFAAFMGAELEFSEDSRMGTNWAVPFVDDWEAAMPLRIREDNPTWRDFLEYHRIAAEVSEGKFLISQLDIHSNMDALSAIRSPSRLCMDLVEQPETIDRAMEQVRPYFSYVYDAVYEAGNMPECGSIGWTPCYSRGKFCTIQCDFICMISPEMSRRFVIPALAEEAAHLDRCSYHYDGPEALPHLDDICGIEEIDVIQQVQGAAHGEHIDWLDLLKRFQAAGKGLEVRGNPDEVKQIHREINPEKVLYIVYNVQSQRDGEELIKWFEKNT